MDSYFNRGWDAETLKEASRDFPLFVRYHLENVYLTLFVAMASSCLGFLVHIAAGLMDLFILLGIFSSVLWFNFFNSGNTRTRFCLFLTVSFFGGAYLGALISGLFGIDPSFIVTAFLGISMGFLGVFMASKFTRSTGLLFFFSSNILILRWAVVLNVAVILLVADPYLMGFPNSIRSILKLGPATLWFITYVWVYSRELVPKIENEEREFVKDAVTLLTDSFGVYSHIVDIWLWATVDEIQDSLEGLFGHWF